MPSNPGRGTTPSDSQRRGSANTSTNRNQVKNPTTTSARSTGRSSATGTSQRPASSGPQRGTTGTTQGNQTQRSQINQSEARQTSSPARDEPSTTSAREQPSTAQSDREMPMQSTRETSEREGIGGQRETGTSIGRRASQGAPVYGGYGYGGIASPFLAIRRFMEDMDRLASDFGFGGSLLSPSLFGQESSGGMHSLQQQGGRAGSGLSTFWNPQVDVFQRGDQIVVRADLPGLKKEDVNVEIDQNTLTIRGERRQELEDRSDDFYRSERSYGTFQRSIALPEGVTPDDAQASFSDGVLEITVKTPRTEQRSKKIQIR